MLTLFSVHHWQDVLSGKDTDGLAKTILAQFICNGVCPGDTADIVGKLYLYRPVKGRVHKNGDPPLAFRFHCCSFWVHPVDQRHARKGLFGRFDHAPHTACMVTCLPDDRGYWGCIPKVQWIVCRFPIHGVQLQEWSPCSFLLSGQ